MGQYVSAIGRLKEYLTMHYCEIMHCCIIMHYWKSQTHSVNDSIYDFYLVFLEIPMENCIVGMLLICPISRLLQMVWFRETWYEEVLRQLKQGLTKCYVVAFENRAAGMLGQLLCYAFL